VRVIRLVAGHDGLFCDGLLAHKALVRALSAHGATVGQEQKVGVGRHLLLALGALEAVDVPERRAKGHDDAAVILVNRVLAAAALGLEVVHRRHGRQDAIAFSSWAGRGAPVCGRAVGVEVRVAVGRGEAAELRVDSRHDRLTE
jgi:hypothetical protein